MNPAPGTPNGGGICSGQRSESFHSWHEGGAHFLFGDGTVRFLSENVDHTQYGKCRSDTPSTFNGVISQNLQNAAVVGVYQRLFGMRDGMEVTGF